MYGLKSTLAPKKETYEPNERNIIVGGALKIFVPHIKRLFYNDDFKFRFDI